MDVAEIVGVAMQKMGVAQKFRTRFARVSLYVPHPFLIRLATMQVPFKYMYCIDLSIILCTWYLLGVVFRGLSFLSGIDFSMKYNCFLDTFLT